MSSYDSNTRGRGMMTRQPFRMLAFPLQLIYIPLYWTVDGSVSTFWDASYRPRCLYDHGSLDLHHMTAAEITHVTPNVKIIVILRNPTSRLVIDNKKYTNMFPDRPVLYSVVLVHRLYSQYFTMFCSFYGIWTQFTMFYYTCLQIVCSLYHIIRVTGKMFYDICLHVIFIPPYNVLLVLCTDCIHIIFLFNRFYT